MDKDQIRAELDARGITYNARLGAEKLQVILDEAIAAEGPTGPTAPIEAEGATGPTGPTAEEQGPTEPEPPAPPVSDERQVDETKIAVLDKHGLVSRVFTLEEHGDGFIELAQEFATKRGLRIGEMYKR